MIQCCKIVSAEGRDFICRNLQVKNLSFKIFEKTRPIGLDTVIQPQQPQQPQQLYPRSGPIYDQVMGDG